MSSPVQPPAERLTRPLRWLAWLGLLLAALVVVPRLLIEIQWFAQFGAEPVILRRWLLQLLGFGLVLGQIGRAHV